MIFRRIRDAVRTLVRQELSAELEAQLAKRASDDAKQVRELVGEMEDVLEKFHRVVAREAKRRARAMKAALSDEPPEAPGPVLRAMEVSDDPAARKAALRARVALARGTRREIATAHLEDQA